MPTNKKITRVGNKSFIAMPKQPLAINGPIRDEVRAVSSFNKKILPFFNNDDYNSPSIESKILPYTIMSLSHLKLLPPNFTFPDYLRDLSEVEFKEIKSRMDQLKRKTIELLPTVIQSFAFHTTSDKESWESPNYHEFIFDDKYNLQSILNPQNQKLNPNDNLFIDMTGHQVAELVIGARKHTMIQAKTFLESFFGKMDAKIDELRPREKIKPTHRDLLTKEKFAINNLEKDIARITKTKDQYINTLIKLDNSKSELIEGLKAKKIYLPLSDFVRKNFKKPLNAKLNDTDFLNKKLIPTLPKIAMGIDVDVRALFNRHLTNLSMNAVYTDYNQNLSQLLSSLGEVLAKYDKGELTREELGTVINLSGLRGDKLKAKVASALKMLK